MTMHSKIKLMQPIIKDDYSHPGVEFAAYTIPRFLISTPSKHLGFLNFPMIMNSRFSEPLALQHRATVTRDFTLFLSLFRAVDRVLFGGKS